MIRLALTLMFSCLAFISNAEYKNSLGAASRVSVEGMILQSERLKIISQNIANSDTTAMTPEGKPYTRKIPVMKIVKDTQLDAEVSKFDTIRKDKAPYQLRYEPHHPAADEGGYVKYPNVDIIMENVDAKEAKRTFEANLSALEITRSNQTKMLEALK